MTMHKSGMSNDRSAGFFRVIRSLLSQEYSGRLLALALSELGRQEPAAFAHFLSQVTGALTTKNKRRIERGDAQFEREWSHVHGRRADLAILLDGAPIALIEIKEDDGGSAGNAAQLTDYIRFVTENPDTNFIYLNRFPPMKYFQYFNSTSTARTNSYDVRYRQLFESLKSFEKKRESAPLTRMILEYLEDIGVDSYRAIDLTKDRVALTFLIVQMANFSHNTGFGKLQGEVTVRRGLELLGFMLGNANVFADWIHESNKSQMRIRPNRRFVVEPGYAPATLKKAAQRNSNGENITPDGPKEATLYVYTRGKLAIKGAPKQWFYVDLGHAVSIAEHTAETFAYVELWGHKKSWWRQSDDFHNEFPNEADAKAEFHTLLALARSAAVKETAGSLQGVLRDFIVPSG